MSLALSWLQKCKRSAISGVATYQASVMTSHKTPKKVFQTVADVSHVSAVQVCERFSLPAVEAGICQRVGMARLQQGRLACALRWLGSCGSEQALAALGHQLAARIAEHASQPASAAKPGSLSMCLWPGSRGARRLCGAHIGR